MVLRCALSLIVLCRLDVAGAVFAGVFFPLYRFTEDFLFCLNLAAPVFPATICTFIINNINDFESDKINHPSRPIASGKISITLALIIYFTFITISASLIFIVKDKTAMFLHFLFLIMVINYDYVKKSFAIFKGLYVAICSSYPLLFLIPYAPEGKNYAAIAISLFFIILGREIFMDILDMAGDKGTIPKLIGERPASQIAVGLHYIAFTMLAPLISSALDAAILVVSALTFWCIAQLWKNDSARFYFINISRMCVLTNYYFVF